MDSLYVILAILANLGAGGILYLTSPNQRILVAPLPHHRSLLIAALAFLISSVLFLQVVSLPVTIFAGVVLAMLMWSLLPIIVVLSQLQRTRK